MKHRLQKQSPKMLPICLALLYCFGQMALPALHTAFHAAEQHAALTENDDCGARCLGHWNTPSTLHLHDACPFCQTGGINIAICLKSECYHFSSYQTKCFFAGSPQKYSAPPVSTSPRAPPCA